MSIASMTGFARVRGTHADAHWAWELKSVNGRGLDLRLRCPPGFDALEATAREVLGKALARGNVQAVLSIDRPHRPAEVRLNGPVLEALLRVSDDVHARTGAARATIDGLLAVRGVVEVVETADSDEEQAALQAAVVDGLRQAVTELAAARRVEGAALASVIEAHLERIVELTAAAETHPARTPAAIKARLADQVKVLLEQSQSLDQDRLHQEAVLIATRADIREEIDRLTAHVAHARRLLAEGGAIGRKLDFLAQEFNREANTLCSKSNDRELTEIGLSLKTAIDQLREQIQNVE
jgi:uncharacterized protein (TIGR00255 family)